MAFSVACSSKNTSSPAATGPTVTSGTPQCSTVAECCPTLPQTSSAYTTCIQTSGDPYTDVGVCQQTLTYLLGQGYCQGLQGAGSNDGGAGSGEVALSCVEITGSGTAQTCAFQSTAQAPAGDVCDNGYTNGTCPSAGLVGCCVGDLSGDLSGTTANCYYDPSTSATNQTDCSMLGNVWSTTAPAAVTGSSGDAGGALGDGGTTECYEVTGTGPTAMCVASTVPLAITCPSGQTEGACPSTALTGCCVSTATSGGVTATTAVCYYDAANASTDESICNGTSGSSWSTSSGGGSKCIAGGASYNGNTLGYTCTPCCSGKCGCNSGTGVCLCMACAATGQSANAASDCCSGQISIEGVCE
jgi:hypothetical protein